MLQSAFVWGAHRSFLAESVNRKEASGWSTDLTVSFRMCAYESKYWMPSDGFFKDSEIIAYIVELTHGHL